MLRLLSLHRNVQPTRTTFTAELRVPIKDSSSSFLRCGRCIQEEIAALISSSLSVGRRASRAAESRTMPKYSNYVVGPSCFSSSRWMLRYSRGEVRHCKCLAHSKLCDVPEQPRLLDQPLECICKAVKIVQCQSEVKRQHQVIVVIALPVEA